MGVGAGELNEFYVGGYGGKWEYFVAFSSLLVDGQYTINVTELNAGSNESGSGDSNGNDLTSLDAEWFLYGEQVNATPTCRACAAACRQPGCRPSQTPAQAPC